LSCTDSRTCCDGFTYRIKNNIAQSLHKVISEHNLPLGSTKEGRDWCIKALHPSDPNTDVIGIPDDSVFPSILMNYQSTFSLSASPGATGTWGFNAQAMPHPINFMSSMTSDSITGDNPVVTEFLNTQLEGSTHYAKYQSWLDQFKRWRLAYFGVTVYQDGPDLANQGTICVCQKPFEPFEVSASSKVHLANAAGSVPICYPDPADQPDYDLIQSMPGAYFNNSKFGAYIPLKLSKLAHTWRSTSDEVMWAGSQPVLDYTTGFQILSVTPSIQGTGGAWPFLSLAPAYVTAADPAFQEGGGDPTSPMCNDFVADICARNLSVATSYSFFFRVGFECMVLPGTVLSSLQKIPPSMDIEALTTYTSVSRLLKDAYPADYNDLAKIWSVIEGALATAAPFLSGIPVYGPFLGALAGAPKTLHQVYDAFAGPKEDKGTPSPVRKIVARRALDEAAIQNVRKRVARKQPKSVALRALGGKTPRQYLALARRIQS
jgi:hypothetical protein